MRTRVISSDSEKRYLLLAYNMLVRIFVVLFHHSLCQRLFSDVLDSSNWHNTVVFAMCGFSRCKASYKWTALISDSPLPMMRQFAYALRSFSDFCVRDADECIGLVLHASIALTSLLPVSYVHAKLLFNRAYASRPRVGNAPKDARELDEQENHVERPQELAFEFKNVHQESSRATCGAGSLRQAVPSTIRISMMI